MPVNLREQTGRTGQPRRTGQVGRTGPACAKASAAALRALADKSARQAGRTGPLEWRELTGRAGLGQLERLGLIVQRELPWKGTRVHG